MLNLIPTLVSVAISGVSKLVHASDGAPGAGTAAGSNASGSATGCPASADPKNGTVSGFQGLLDAQTGTLSGQPLSGLVPGLQAKLAAGGDPPAPAAVTAHAATDKTDVAVPPATAPQAGADLATLIGAAAAIANPAANQPVPVSAPAAVRPAVATPDLAAIASTATGADLSKAPAYPTHSTAPTPTSAPALERNLPGASPATFNVQAATAPAIATDPGIAALQSALATSQPLVAAKAHSAAEAAPLRSDGMAVQSLSAQAGLATPATPAAVPSARLDMPVGTEGWDQALGQRVVWMVSQRDQTAEIHVHPPELGPVTVTVNVSGNVASASFVAQHAATREAIADAMPRLKDMFAAAGIGLGQVNVSAESFSQGGGAGQPYQGGSPAPAPLAGPGLATGASAVASPPRSARSVLGLVDTFA